MIPFGYRPDFSKERPAEEIEKVSSRIERVAEDGAVGLSAYLIPLYLVNLGLIPNPATPGIAFFFGAIAVKEIVQAGFRFIRRRRNSPTSPINFPERPNSPTKAA